MAEMILTNLPMIATATFTFLIGIGIGAAITDAINRRRCENEKRNNSDT